MGDPHPDRVAGVRMQGHVIDATGLLEACILIQPSLHLGSQEDGVKGSLSCRWGGRQMERWRQPGVQLLIPGQQRPGEARDDEKERCGQPQPAVDED
ncbi:hypothetical protein DLREEDagrD3_24510 [Denitratisoma sp. agr-D3]